MILKQKEYLLTDEKIRDLGNRLGLSFFATKVLVGRGICDEKSAKEFLSPSINDLHNPFSLKDMQILVDKINDAVKTKKRVLIFGDYDVDGISATAILYKYFEKQNLIPSYFLPNRYEDGYGLTIESVDKIIELYNPQLIITVDCGISCYKEIDYIKSKNIDVVITDHHELAEILPSCPIIDAKQENQEYPFRELCGAGVALKVVQALGENLDEYLPICAIATVADIVSLTGENRAIVTLGLKLMDNLPLGIKMLLDEFKISNINSSDIAFKIAPKINATGRMGDATISLLLYISKDKKIIAECIKKLDEMNTKRQEFCSSIYLDAINQYKSQNQNKNYAIILSSKDWDSGLLGIVCSKFVDKFNKPTFLFSEVDGMLKGSVRSNQNINIHDVITSTKTLLETFGGHTMAAGLTLKKENFDTFKLEIENYLKTNYTPQDFINQKYYDIEINPSDITLKLMGEIDMFEPYGCGNPKPIFYSTFNSVSAVKMKNFTQHININVSHNFTILAFNYGDYIDNLKYSKRVECAFELQLNSFKGKSFVKGLCKYLVFKGYNKQLEEYAYGNYLNQLKFKKSYNKNSFFSYESLIYTLEKLTIKSNYGTIIVANNINNVNKIYDFLISNNYEFHIGRLNNNTTNNAIIIGLNSFENIDKFDNVVFLEPLLCMDYLNNFSGNLYLPKNHQLSCNFNIDTSRENFTKIYKNLLVYENKIIAENEYDYFLKLKKICPETKNKDYSNFVCIVETFVELNFLTISNENNIFNISINKDAEKKELSCSKFYLRVCDLVNNKK